MATRSQAQKQKPRLNKREIRVLLASRGWSQADLANAIGKSLTAVNLTINHGLYPSVDEAIRKELHI